MRCDEGYRCAKCGGDVERITDSALYLRYILGEVPLEVIHLQAECHVACDTEVAQYIVAAGFRTVVDASPFAKAALPADYVREQEQRVTRAWLRLQAIPRLGLSLPEYPLAVTPFDAATETLNEPMA